ncbi:MAG: ATP-dependent Clp protease proteolytic subunit [Selenomonadaceae bacterium]|nr:ATP-dependent Clp protease proteolytic subunit [Selenomonadaceae bacterium]
MTFFIYNQIDSTTAAALSAQIDSIDELEINSSGGDVFAALAIVDTIKNRDITIRVKGLAASAATLLLCAGNKVIAAQNSLFLLHAPSCMLSGQVNAAKLAELQMTMEKVEGQLKAIYSARMKDVDLSQEKWLTADEALAMNLIDEIDGRVEITAQNGLLFVNKCVFATKPQAVEVKDVAAEILAVIKDQINSGALGVAGSVPPVDETERRINLVANYANGVR